MDRQRARSPRERALANIEALQALNRIENEPDREPDEAQLDALRGYSGWGGCADAFGNKPEWADIAGEVERLLDPDEYAQARSSTLTAFYTPGPVVASMWDVLERLGVGEDEHTHVLEPGCGTGNFISTGPDRARMTGVEIDPVSARIAAALNPTADIINADLGECLIATDSYDAAVGNVPYSGDITMDYRLSDGGTARLPLHDYFIERAVDSLRPGGVAVLLTSRHTMDKRIETTRADLARKAELVGMVRLPSSTFGRQAGTQAVTDVLVLRKRAKPLDHIPDLPWIHAATVAVPGYQDVTVTANRLIADDPAGHTVGEITPVLGRFGGDFDVTLDGDEHTIGGLLASKLDAQLKGQPTLDETAGPRGAEPACMRKPDHLASYEYTVDRHGVVWYGDDAIVTDVAHGDGKEARRLRGMIRLRDLVRGLQSLELDPDADDASIESVRQELNQEYDGFAAEFGRLCDRANRRAYDSDESGCHLVQSLEETDAQGRFTGKAALFERRVLRPAPPMPTRAASLEDALNISLDRTGHVDLDLIGRLTDMPSAEAEAGLGDLVVRDPDTDEPMPAEDYVCGDVIGKREHVERLADDLRTRGRRLAEHQWLKDNDLLPRRTGNDHLADMWIDMAGLGAWHAMTDTFGAPSYADLTAITVKVGDTPGHWDLDWTIRPGTALALASRALDEMPENHAPLTTLANEPAPEPRRHGTNPLWDAMAWGPRRVSYGSPSYHPILKSARLEVREAAAFVVKLTHSRTVSEQDKAAILETLFTTRWTMTPDGGWEPEEQADPPLGKAVREDLFNGMLTARECVSQMLEDPSICEYLLHLANQLPGVTQIQRDGRPADLHATAAGWREFKARREQAIAAATPDDGPATLARADRLDHLAAMLRKAEPSPLTTEQIKAPLGAPWIPAKDIHDFMIETFHVGGLTDAKRAQYRVDWIPELGQWRVGYSGGKDISRRAAAAFGTKEINPFQLLERVLNNTRITVTKDSETETNADGKPKRVNDPQATMAAVEKADAIRDAWNQWVFKDPERARRLTETYNRRFNNIHPRHVDGSYLTTPGIADGISLRPHQKDAVARALRSDEGTLVAHVVGAGKTFEGVALTHEAKRLGKASKPMLVVPNHLVDQWANDYLRLYPTARILTMGKDATRSPEAVRRFWGRVMNGDWDAVIVPVSRFSQLHVSRARRVANMHTRVEEYVNAVETAAHERGDKDPTVKRLEAARRSVENALKRLRDGKESKDEQSLHGIEFEQLGVDMLFVDEAHQFKNLGVPVASSDLGMQVTSAAKCEDLLDKCEWLRESGHAANIAFATGTPVSNSMSELYNMQRYLAPGTLKAQGLDTFAAWAGTFGQIVPTVELKPEGTGFQVKQRFARFQNLPELMSSVKQFTDMITNDDIDLDLPELEQIPVIVPATDSQKWEMEQLVERAKLVRNGLVPPEVDNLLRITGDGRKIALDPKLLNDGVEREPLADGGKIDQCARNVARIWAEEQERHGTQLVFCDSSTPAAGGWNAYADLKRRLVEMGVPENEIAFVHDAGDNPERREQLFERVRKGEIRVLLGSTQKLGTGTNVQDRLCAIHHLDCPWRPADLEQRRGRIQRQGNMYGLAREYMYATEGTFDAYMYQTVQRKQQFISQLMSSKSPAREASDLSAEVVTLSNIKALATGNPDVQRILTLDTDLKQLTLSRAAWAQAQADTRRDIEQTLLPQVRRLERILAEQKDDRPMLDRAMAIHEEHRASGVWEGMTVMGRPVGDRQTACRLLHDAAMKAKDGDQIGEYDGLAVVARRGEATGTATLVIRAVHEHEANQPVPAGLATGQGSVVSQLDRLIRNTAGLTNTAERLDKARAELAEARETAEMPWDREREYRDKLHELQELRKSNPDDAERPDTGTVTNGQRQGATMENDPDIMLEQRRKNACERARNGMFAPDARPTAQSVALLHRLVDETHDHDPESPTGNWRMYPSGDAERIAGEGLTAGEMAEKRYHGGWEPDRDKYMRINEQGDWEGKSQEQADRLVWEQRDRILDAASWDANLDRDTIERLEKAGRQPEPEPQRRHHRGL